MQSAFDTERKDRTIEMLAKEKDYQESQKVTQRLIFVAGLIVLLIILLGLIYFLRQKHKTNRILNEQKNHSEELNHLKDKLFSIIAHDLKGPLHSLKALLNLATSNNISEAELKYLLGTIGHNTEYTTDLVDNLLMWAKDNLQGSSITPQTLDLTELVQNNIQLLNPQAEKKGIKIQYSKGRSEGVYADRNMIDLVLRNILSNAIKFTPDSGVVTVSVGAEHSHTTVSIRDTGVGIRKELHGKLFGNQNYSTPGTANEKGTGLGLILCKEFVEKNGGKISVKSAEGSGSTFTFTIPSAEVKELAVDTVTTELTYALQG
jgi:signal transduction histidine kinase